MQKDIIMNKLLYKAEENIENYSLQWEINSSRPPFRDLTGGLGFSGLYQAVK